MRTPRKCWRSMKTPHKVATPVAPTRILKRTIHTAYPGDHLCPRTWRVDAGTRQAPVAPSRNCASRPVWPMHGVEPTGRPVAAPEPISATNRIVDAPGQGVLRIRLALTALVPTDTAESLAATAVPYGWDRELHQSRRGGAQSIKGAGDLRRSFVAPACQATQGR